MSSDAHFQAHPTIIDNPLVLQDYRQLEEEVEEFHRRLKLQNVVDLQTLIKGARIAKQPYGHSTPGLTDPEIEAISNEGSQSFLQTRGLLVTIMATACAAITQGWQQSTINGSSLLQWQKDLGLGNGDKLLVGFINAAPWLSGSLIGTWLSDPLQEKFGRRPALFIAAIFCVAFVIGTAHCNSWESLLVCRVVLGVGIGSKASIAPIFAAEAAPDRHRGQVLMLWQLFDAFGIFLGFVCAFIVRDSWRVLLSTAIIPAIVLLFLVFICPESPRFLIQRNRYADAYKSLLELRGTEIQAARDLYYIHAQLQAEATTVWNPHEEQSWWSDRENVLRLPEMDQKRQLFQADGVSLHKSADPKGMHGGFDRDGVATTMWREFPKAPWHLSNNLGFILTHIGLKKQINVLAFYSSDLLDTESTFTSRNKVKWYNFGFGLANFFFTFPAYNFIDSRGRRPLLLVSFGGMFLSLVAVSSFFKIADHDTRVILVALFSTIFFVFFYSIGAGPIPFTLSAEVFPLCVREVGMSFSVMVNFLGLGLLVLFVPQLTKAFGRGKACGQSNDNQCDGQANLLFFFSGLNVLALILIFLLVPETNYVKLEEMNSIFRRATKEHVLNHILSLRPLYRKSSHREEREDTVLQDWEA